MNKIQKFIKNNKLDFADSGSSLNGNCVILAGYALYLFDDDNDFNKLQRKIEKNGFHKLSHTAVVELERVFDYTYENNYAEYWNTPEARIMYKF